MLWVLEQAAGRSTSTSIDQSINQREQKIYHSLWQSFPSPHTLWSEEEETVSVLEKEKKNPRSIPKSNIKRHRCAFKAKQPFPESPFPKKSKGNMISLCNEFSNPLTLLLLGAPAFEQQDYGRTRESRNKKEKVWGKTRKKKQDPAVKPALPSPSTRYNACVSPPFVRDMNPSQTGAKR
jgi:hypothetical protein